MLYQLSYPGKPLIYKGFWYFCSGLRLTAGLPLAYDGLQTPYFAGLPEGKSAITRGVAALSIRAMLAGRKSDVGQGVRHVGQGVGQ